ncbi:alpha/beta hydrolase [Biformimicrobium ophioploci]|nr:alpha/beta hydrolase [Microbulbifer sp. NKW57]
MDISKIHPELRNIVRFIPPLPFHSRLFVWLTNFLQALVPTKKSLSGVEISSRRLSTASVRIYTPQGPLSGAGLLWIHGGGLISGRAAQDDQVCARYAEALRLVVVSVDYRLAPKHPFPAALDDCHAAWSWFVQEAANLGVDPKRIAVSGQSAGAGLAASLSQKLSDESGQQPAAQVLFCPMLDDRTADRAELDAVKHRIWNNRSNRAGWSAYLGQPPGAQQTPAYAVPARRSSLANLPPAWIGIGDIDLFYDEASEYARRLKNADVRCTFHTVPMAPHAFETIVPDAEISKGLFADNYRFLKDVLDL